MMITSIGRPTGLTRRGILGRAAAAVVTASMASVLAEKRASAYCPPPGRCSGLESCSCHGGGCHGPGGPDCWTYTDSTLCRTYECCDQTCADGSTNICLYLICNCC